MKTGELPVGAHVAYDQNEQRDYHNFIEAYVICHQPRGTKSNYWGKNGNHNTVGIVTSSKWNRDADDQPILVFAWVRPQTIHYLWTDYAQILVRNKEQRDAQLLQSRIEKEDRQERVDAIPVSVLNALGLRGYFLKRLVENDSQNISISVDRLEAVIKAVLAGHPATVQQEIETALSLLV